MVGLEFDDFDRRGMNMKKDKILRIYTDGGCSGNQSDKNFGGWGAVLEFGGHTMDLYCG